MAKRTEFPPRACWRCTLCLTTLRVMSHDSRLTIIISPCLKWTLYDSLPLRIAKTRVDLDLSLELKACLWNVDAKLVYEPCNFMSSFKLLRSRNANYRHWCTFFLVRLVLRALLGSTITCFLHNCWWQPCVYALYIHVSRITFAYMECELLMLVNWTFTTFSFLCFVPMQCDLLLFVCLLALWTISYCERFCFPYKFHPP